VYEITMRSTGLSRSLYAKTYPTKTVQVEIMQCNTRQNRTITGREAISSCENTP